MPETVFVSGADFGVGAMPSMEAVLGVDAALPAPPDTTKGNAKGNKGSRKKGKGKGGQGGEPSADGSNPPPDPEAVTTPLTKAKALAKAVFLGMISMIVSMFVSRRAIPQVKHKHIRKYHIYIYLFMYIKCCLDMYIFKHAPRLKEAEEARTLNVSIEGMECSGELCAALKTHAENQTNLYRKLSVLIANNVNTDQEYQQYFDTAAANSSWFKTRKKVANSMKAAGSTSAAGN